MKRLLALFVVLAMLASSAYAEGDAYGIMINGTQVTFADESGNSLEPVLISGRLYVPAEPLGEMLCIDVETDPQQQTLQISGKKVTFTAGGKTVPVQVVDGVVYMPVLLFATMNDLGIALEGTNYCLTCEALGDYQKGEKALQAGDYEQACASFARAGDFSDAPEKIRVARYLQAEKFQASGDYTSAADAFTKAGSYKDAAGRIGESWYLQGKKLFEQGRMEEASAAYKKAGNYKDAAALAVSVFADDGVRKMNAGDYKGAYGAFSKVADTKEGQQYISQVLYLLAKQQASAGKTDNAISIYQLVADYSDAKTQLAILYYKQASTAEAAGKKTTAIEAYKKAGSYLDAQEKWKKLTYELAKTHQTNQKYDDAFELFDTIRGYSDVDNRLSVNAGLKSAAKKAERVKLASSISVGDTINFGSYVHVDSGSSRKQTIQWEVMKVDGAKLFLISRYALDKKPYHSSNVKSVNWSGCSLRTWLNGTFMQNAFTQTERSAIVSTSITSKTNTSSTTKTSDKIFLLTYNQLLSNLEKADRVAKTKKNVAVASWSRDRYTGMSYSSTAYSETMSASNSSSYQKVTNSMYIRPAMWVNLEANYDWESCIVKKSTTDKYSSIRKLMTAGNYEEALEKLAKQTGSTEVTELTRECRYQLGCEALRKGNLASATQYLNLLKRFKHKDSVELLAIIDLLK